MPGVGDVVLDLHEERVLPATTFAAIYGCHVLEHCYPQETPAILRRLREALLPGGTLRLSVPDLRLVVKNCLDSSAYGDARSALSVLYGGDFSRTTPAPDLHRQAFWRERLEQLLKEAGFVRIRTWRRGQYAEIDALGDYATVPHGADGQSLISLNLEADRPGPTLRVAGNQAASVQGPAAAAPPQPHGTPRRALSVAAAASAKARCPIDVSIILGTVNRVEMLKRCVGAIRDSLASSDLRYEIVVAYGREDEPSLPWMQAQSDIVPLLGGMEGAIEAFNRAYEASRGRYICQINDDVLVDGDSIARACQHLDADAGCSVVVFKFDRGDGKGYRHEWLAGVLHPNQMVVRRESCEAVVERLGAFWGDAEHRTDRTYGGDSAFGVVCRSLSLRLDSVEGVTCRDCLSQDELRAQNAQAVAPNHAERWRALFGPLMDGSPITTSAIDWPNLYLPRAGRAPRRSPVEAGRPLRLLLLSLQTVGEPQHAQRKALSRIGPTTDVSWWPLDRAKERAILDAARAHKPELLIAQVQSSGWSQEFLAALRDAVGPSCTMLNWTGDVRTHSGQRVERWMVELAQKFDLMLADNTTYGQKLKLEERVPAACGYVSCGVDLDANPWAPDAAEQFDVVFLGTNYKNLDGGARETLLSSLDRSLPHSLRIYGRGWNPGPVSKLAHDFVAGRDAAAAMRAARVMISTSLFNDLGRYTSDRLKRAMAAGAVVALRRFPDLEGLGLRAGTNCLVWETFEELVALLAHWTGPDRQVMRQQIRQAAATLARARFSWARSTEELLAIVRDHRARRGLP